MSKYTLSIYEVLLYKDVRLEKIAEPAGWSHDNREL